MSCAVNCDRHDKTQVMKSNRAAVNLLFKYIIHTINPYRDNGILVMYVYIYTTVYKD